MVGQTYLCGVSDSGGGGIEPGMRARDEGGARGRGANAGNEGYARGRGGRVCVWGAGIVDRHEGDAWGNTHERCA